jgi:hypothetical protein
MIEKAADPLASELASLRAKLAESEREKARLRDAFTHEAEVLAAKLAEWEAAGRALAAEARTWRRYACVSWTDWPKNVECEGAANATDRNPLANRLVAEAGGTHG